MDEAERLGNDERCGDRADKGHGDGFAGKFVTAALVAAHVSIASVLFDKPFLVVLDLRGFFWCEVRPKLRGWTRVRKGMQVDRVEIVCGPAEAAFHGPKKLRRCEVPPGRVRIEAAQGQYR